MDTPGISDETPEQPPVSSKPTSNDSSNLETVKGLLTEPSSETPAHECDSSTPQNASTQVQDQEDPSTSKTTPLTPAGSKRERSPSASDKSNGPPRKRKSNPYDLKPNLTKCRKDCDYLLVVRKSVVECGLIGSDETG